MAVKLSISLDLTDVSPFRSHTHTLLTIQLCIESFHILKIQCVRLPIVIAFAFFVIVQSSIQSQFSHLPPAFSHTNTDLAYFVMFTSWRLHNRPTAVNQIRDLSLLLSFNAYTVYIL